MRAAFFLVSVLKVIKVSEAYRDSHYARAWVLFPRDQLSGEAFFGKQIRHVLEIIMRFL